MAVGREMCAAFTPSNELPLDLQNAFKDSMEELWLLPMRPYFKRFILSKRADISNSGSGDGNRRRKVYPGKINGNLSFT